MNEFVRIGLLEYRKHRAARQSFLIQTKRIAELLWLNQPGEEPTGLLMLTPMIEVGWVDGRIGSYEQDAILEAADIYGLLEAEESYADVMERLSSRPHTSELERWWNEIETLGRKLPSGRCAAMASYMLQQTRYVSSLSQSHTYGTWRGMRAGQDEQVMLETASRKLLKLRSDARESVRKNTDEKVAGSFLKILPLVKVAWADGRISKKERRMIFDSAFELGVKPTADNIARLAGWLKLSPDDNALNDGLTRLGSELSKLSPDELSNQKYDLLSRCTLLAEASGGNSKSASGGPRISSEEKDAVKHIARILHMATRSDN